MCGRFNVTEMPGLQALLDHLGINLRLPPPQLNIAPTDNVLLLNDGIGQFAKWWLTPSWAPQINSKYSMFNARSENLVRSRAFQRPFESQRGIIPMSSFIEWRTDHQVKQPWLIKGSNSTLAVAALWDRWKGGGHELLSCTVVTTAAAPEFSPWHSRMPVMLDIDELDRWLDNDQVISPSDNLFDSRLKFPLSLCPLSNTVGNSRNKEITVLDAVGEVIQLTGS